MKSIIYTTALLLYGIGFAQDISFLKSISEVNPKDAREISEQIVQLTTLNYRYYGVTNNGDENSYTIIYAPKDITDLELESKEDWHECLFVDFKKNNNQVLTLKAIRGKYIDIFPTWKKFFKEKAHMEYTITDPSTRETSKQEYKFELVEGKNSKIPRWSIENKKIALR
ncbi:hypothetical protein GV828_02775 [Flavobacterium sp. NST-5]|uniref:Uncharacterized protein n=1 Tax=Flavobacterium ichthyis TaxID=2698827 RepID=A0ABW9Z5K0_9FLAO|nr:hypothetical protein [Flavobacterium ichthyis]NBL64120.1 hypothetical protein [Flavobacterium ichthyis]